MENNEIVGYDLASGKDKSAYYRGIITDGTLRIVETGECELREVSARRASKLRKRRDTNVNYSHRTSTGRARYTWLRTWQ